MPSRHCRAGHTCLHKARQLGSRTSNEAQSHKPWRKVLWTEQPGYADNHTDESFLESLIVSTQPVRDYWQVVRGSAAITQQMSTVVIACAVAVHLYQVSQARLRYIQEAQELVSTC